MPQLRKRSIIIDPLTDDPALDEEATTGDWGDQTLELGRDDLADIADDNCELED